MNRLTMTFIVLAATGGCMAVDRDPADDYGYGTPRRPSSQAWPPSNQASWRGPDGKMVQANPNDWGSQSYGSGSGANTAWSNPPQNSSSAKTYKSSAGSPTTTVSAKTTTRPSPTKLDDKVLRTSHTETKTSCSSDRGLPSATAGAKCGVKPAMAEAKSPPINLGVLRLLNSKRVTFHYEVKDPASAGVSGLELWGTTDTRSWKKYDIVTRTPSSLVVDVKDEGLYGFTMIARGKGELAKNQPPQGGEPPQVWVAVDLTKPVVQLLGAELNIMAQTPALVIRWSAKDQHFGPRPITLLYAERLEGPWSPVAANVENTGRYEWCMPPCVPSNVFVRVQASDMMGNVSMAQTTTLHIPGRALTSAVRGEPMLAEPPHLGSVLPATPYEANLRPVAAIVPNPAVSILSVDSGD